MEEEEDEEEEEEVAKQQKSTKIDKSDAGKNIYLYKSRQHGETQQPQHADLHTPAARLPLIKAALIVLKRNHSRQPTSQTVNPLITSATRRPRLIFLFYLRLFFFLSLSPFNKRNK